MLKKLTPLQARFVDEYLIDLNGTKAAIRAGYSEKSARVTAAQNLTKANIMAAILEAKGKRSERTQINADWLLNRLADEAEADMADLYDEKGQFKKPEDWPAVWRKGLVSGIEYNKEGQVIKVKLSERIKRYELIGRHVEVKAFGDAPTVPSEVHVHVHRPGAD